MDKLIIGSACLAMLFALFGSGIIGYQAATPEHRIQLARELLAYSMGLGTALFALAQGKKSGGDTTVNAAPTDSVTVNTQPMNTTQPAVEGEAGG